MGVDVEEFDYFVVISLEYQTVISGYVDATLTPTFSLQPMVVKGGVKRITGKLLKFFGLIAK